MRKRKERRNGQIERPSCTHRLRARRLLPDRNEKVFKTTIDQSALDVDRIFFSGGRIGFQIETTLDELKKAIVFQLKDVAVR